MWRATNDRIVPSGPATTGLWKGGGGTHRPTPRTLPCVAEVANLLDLVDVDEMRRLGEPKRHDGDETLSAGQHASVARRELPKERHRFLHGRGHVANERCWFHGRKASNVCTHMVIGG